VVPIKQLSWPNSLLLEFVDPNVLSGHDEMKLLLLRRVADLSDPSDYPTHENQLILAKQLIDHGANVNAGWIPEGASPLHNACYTAVVTNLDFVELPPEAAADPNAQEHLGNIPLVYTTPYSPGTAKFLLKWPTADVNITIRSGESILAMVKHLFTAF
jgi:hypothetical protein